MSLGRALLAWPGSPYLSAAELDTQAQALRDLGFDVEATREQPVDLKGIALLVTSSKVRVGAELVATADGLRLVVAATSGHEHLDLDALRAAGAQTARCPLARRDAVIDTTLAMSLSIWRGLPALDAAARSGLWARADLPKMGMRQIRDTTVGIFGYGVIGRRAREVWTSLGARVLVHDPAHPSISTPAASLPEHCNLITLHCALTESSRGMVDSKFVAAMKPGAILLNTARGECVDEYALLDAPHLGGIGLDVFATEPWSEKHALADRPNVFLTPHAAGYHRGLGSALTEEITATARAFARGDELPGQI